MVGLVVVSHSPALAEAAVAFAMEMAQGGTRPRIATAAGVGDGVFGTDAAAIRVAIEEVDEGEGVVVLMDLGSAVLSSELALELIDPDLRDRVYLTSAPLVEGLVAAVVQASSGESPEEIIREAAASLRAKQEHLGNDHTTGESAAPVAGQGETATFKVGNPHGIHARPAARLVAEAKRSPAQVSIRNKTVGSPFVPATSLSRVAALGALSGHEIEIVASGPGAADAITAITGLASRQFEDHADDDRIEDVRRQADPSPPGGPRPASPGIAIGPKWTLSVVEPSIPDSDGEFDAAAERRLLDTALASVRHDIAASRDRLIGRDDNENAAIFEAFLLLLDDEEITADIDEAITSGRSAAVSWSSAMDRVENDWARLADPYLKARAADVRAVRNQVLNRMLGTDAEIHSQRGILVAADLTPTVVARLDPDLVTGIVTTAGSPSSHMAILARSLGIPAVVCAGASVLDVADGTQLIVDGSAGTILVDPPAARVLEYKSRAADLAVAAAEARGRAHEPALTKDGTHIEVAVNMGSAADVPAVLAGGADSVGLVRTEFLFLDRKVAPSIDEQESEYRKIADGVGNLPLTIRTLDVGGDKPLAYLQGSPEANPFLGVRGIRLSLSRLDVFRDQLIAIARVAADRELSVLFPMVTAVAEIRQATRILDEVLVDQGVEPDRVGVGMMVEVPAVALNTAAFAPYVDFFSIGTNDLTQYGLASERGNPSVAHLSDGLDPGVLRLIEGVVSGSGDARVAVCGEIASDLDAVPVLIGLGVDELSVIPRGVPAVKDEVRRWSATKAAALVDEVKSLASAAAVRAAVAARRKDR
jgi:phosphocarrier protein FPr